MGCYQSTGSATGRTCARTNSQNSENNQIFLPESAGQRKLSEQNKDLLYFGFKMTKMTHRGLRSWKNAKIYVADFGPLDRAF